MSQPERAGHREMSMLRHCLARLGARLELVAVFEVGDEEHAVSIHIGETDTAKRIRSAVEAVVADGKVRTYDMMRLTGRQEVLDQGACSTTQMTDAIIAKLQA
ncbi:MAG: hypothetical protein IIA44_06375 [Acidobacteria bacterium]|nr:hypothetical protein [Acidobacteriota bacterium]